MKRFVLALPLAAALTTAGPAAAANSLVDVYAGYQGDTTVMSLVNNSGLNFTNVVINAVAGAFAGESESIGALLAYTTGNVPFSNYGGAFSADYDDYNGSTDTTYQVVANTGSHTYYSSLFSPTSNASNTIVEFLGNEFRAGGDVDFNPVVVGSISVPGPIAGAGLPVLLGLAGFAAVRRRKAADGKAAG